MAARRNLTLTLAALAAIAAGSLVPAGAATGSASAPHCGNADLRASYRTLDAGTSHRWGRLILTNRSAHACWTRGYAGLSYVGLGDGTQIGPAATRSGPAPRRVLLQPGQRAHADVQETLATTYSHRTCGPVHVDGFRVYVPDARLAQYVAHPTTGCASIAVHLLDEHALTR